MEASGSSVPSAVFICLYLTIPNWQHTHNSSPEWNVTEYLRAIDMVANAQYIVVGGRWIEEADHFKIGRRPLDVKIRGRTQPATG